MIDLDNDTLKLLDEYYIYKVGRRTREQSAQHYISYLKQFFRWIEKPVHMIVIEDVDKYIFYLKTEVKNSNNTQKVKQASIRLFYAWYSKRYQKPNPTDMLRPIQEEVNIPIMPTIDEFMRMVNSCDQTKARGRRDAAILCLMADTGIRLAECAALRVGNVELHSSNFLLTVPKIKGKRERIVPFGKLVSGDFIAEYFMAYFMEIKNLLNYRYNDPLFKQDGVKDKGGLLGRRGISQMVAKYIKKAGIDKRITVHSFRHFFGTYSTLHGTDLQTLRQLMGHAWIETTMRYIHIAEIMKGTSLDYRVTTGQKSPDVMRGFVDIAKKTRFVVKKISQNE